MIPLKDENNTISYPLIRLIILIICCIVFFIQITSDNNFLINYYGFKPASIFNDLGNTNFFFPLTLITSIFMHGGWLHLIGNMIYLWIFADNVEDKLGKKTFVYFYLLSGVIGSLSHAIADINSQVPMIGASGAIAGILGAYLYYFPSAKVLVLIPFFIFFTVRVPAYILLIFWFIYQFINLPVQNSSVAWLAHIGGFIFGYLFAILYKPKSKVKGKSIFVKKKDDFWN